MLWDDWELTDKDLELLSHIAKEMKAGRWCPGQLRRPGRAIPTIEENCVLSAQCQIPLLSASIPVENPADSRTN